MTESASSLIYLDTNIFIKAVEGLDDAAVPAKTLITMLSDRRAGIAATDAVHLVSAVQTRCRYFVSADRDFDRLPEGMERVNCDRDDLPRLLKELS